MPECVADSMHEKRESAIKDRVSPIDACSRRDMGCPIGVLALPTLRESRLDSASNSLIRYTETRFVGTIGLLVMAPNNNEGPSDLEATALLKFDSLVDKGEIFYEQPRTSVIWAQGFQVFEQLLHRK